MAVFNITLAVTDQYLQYVYSILLLNLFEAHISNKVNITGYCLSLREMCSDILHWEIKCACKIEFSEGLSLL